jgi:branched-chain amino acid aminotransferase
MSALAEAEEVFITSSTRDVQTVHRVDSRSLAAPGPVTTAVREDFLLRASADVDP